MTAFWRVSLGIAVAVIASVSFVWWNGVTATGVEMGDDAPAAGYAVDDGAAVDDPATSVHQGETEVAAAEPGALVFPVARHDLGSVISWFGDSRDGGRRMHLGIDIAAPIGTPVLAPATGVVDRLEIGGAGGRAVWLRDRATDRSYYFAHLDAIAVERGQRVRAGGLIGTVGNTGNAVNTPPHLHFAVREGRSHLDPWSLLSAAVSRPGARAYVADGDPGPVMRTRMDGAAIRSAPGGGTTIAVLPRLQTVTVLGTSGTSVFVRYRHYEGYMAAWLLEEV